MNSSENTNEMNRQGAKKFRPSLAFYHQNAKGTGCAIQLEVLPAQADDDGCIMLAAANQMSVGNLRATPPVFPRFDWANKVVVKLGFNDLCAFLQVFRGECESIADGRGLYHRSASANTRIVLRHVLEPESAYSLEIYRSSAGGENEVRSHFCFSSAEATGLCEAIAGSMSVICFGVPMERSNASAA